MPLVTRKTSLLAKIETTYGTDSVPTGGANAILVSNVEITPIEQDLVPRDLIRPYLGISDDLIAASWKVVAFDVECAGSGALGTAPKWSPLLRGCGFAETINAGVSVVYNPISSSHEALSLYINTDGVNHKMVGARGSVDFY